MREGRDEWDSEDARKQAEAEEYNPRREDLEGIKDKYDVVLSAAVFALIGFFVSNATRPAIGVAIGAFGWLSFWAGYTRRWMRSS
jgi:hypothetical protein